MAADRKPGSDRGRPALDWERAFQFYASLPDSDRSYRAVAEEFGVSVRTVEAHGGRDGWRERLAAIRAEAAQTADARLAEQRAEQYADLDLMIDASLTVYAHQLRAGQVKVAPVDLQRLFKLREELWAQQAAQAAHRRGEQAATQAFEDPVVRRLEIARALYDAGAFDRLKAQLHPTPADTPPESNPT